MKKIILTLLVSLLSGQFFIEGEKYNYNVFFGPIKMGKASLETKPIEFINNQEVYHFNFSVKTSKLGDRLYKIRDEINSWIDKEGFYLVKQEKNIREANFRRKSKTMIKNNTAVTNGKKYILPGTQDCFPQFHHSIELSYDTSYTSNPFLISVQLDYLISVQMNHLIF